LSENIFFNYTYFGKPFLPGADNFHFNISHSGEWVVCATDEKPVGIDIERVSPIDVDIAKNYFSAGEYADLLAKKASEQSACFYDLWTLKESYIKQNGKGLSIALDSFSIRIDEEKNVIFLSEKEVSQAVFFRQYLLDENYKMAVCSMTNFFEEIEIVLMQDIMNLF